MMLSYRRLAALVVAVASLAVPASAWAHGSVYTDIAQIDTDPAPGTFMLADQTRHVVTSHGFTFVLRETNGAADKGMIDYSRLPGDYRASLPPAEVLSAGDTAAQPHATCRGAAVLTTDAAIRGWQEADPFYNYVPFQKTSAGLEDDPALWIQDIKALTGNSVDLSQVSDDPAQAVTELTTLCSGLAGTFTPADETQTSTASLNSGYAHLLTEPLDAEILSLSADLATAQGAASAAAAQVAAKSATDKENAALKAENARLKAIALSIEPVGKPTVRQLADRVQVSVTGPAGKSVTIRIVARKAKALKLKSRVLAKATARLRVD